MNIIDQRFPDAKEIGLATCGDWHLGAKTCDEDAVDDWLAKIKENKWYVLLMGDLCENATIGSVGAVFEQKMTPQEQVRYTADKLDPIKDYIIGAIGGNHGARSVKSVGLDPDEIICWELGIPYFGTTAMGRIQVGDRAHWKIVAHHGAGGGALLGSKLNVVAEKMSKIVPMADLYLAGHTHADVAGSDIRDEITVARGKVRVRQQRRHFSGTGSLLDYRGSYAERMMLPPASKVQIVHMLGDEAHRRSDDDASDNWEKRYMRVPHWY